MREQCGPTPTQTPAEREIEMSMSVIRLAAATAVFAGFIAIAAAPKVSAAVGQTALSKCVDAVVAACNKKKDASVNPCVNNGVSQCEKKHRK